MYFGKVVHIPKYRKTNKNVPTISVSRLVNKPSSVAIDPVIQDNKRRDTTDPSWHTICDHTHCRWVLIHGIVIRAESGAEPEADEDVLPVVKRIFSIVYDGGYVGWPIVEGTCDSVGEIDGDSSVGNDSSWVIGAEKLITLNAYRSTK